MPRPKKEQPNHAGGLYEVKITTGKTMDGKLIRKSFYSSTSKEDAKRQAEAWRIEREVAERAGTPLIEKDPLFEEWALTWLNTYKKKSVRASTFETTYANTLMHDILPEFGQARLSEIRPMSIETFYSRLAERYSKSKLEKVRICLNSIFDTAIDNDLTLKNPAKRIALPKTKPTEGKRTYSREQANALFEFAKDHPKGLSVLILLRMGLRRSELLGLQWGDFDPKRHTLSICRSAILAGGRVLAGPPKSDTSNRTLPIPDDLYEVMAKRRCAADQWIISNAKGGIMSPDNWTTRIYGRVLSDFAGERGVEAINAHELRHTCGTLLYQKTKDIYAVSKFLGHADIGITTKIYVHSDVDTLRDSLGF